MQIRMNWPLGTEERTALLALHEAYVLAIDDVRTKFAADRLRASGHPSTSSSE